MKLLKTIISIFSVLALSTAPFSVSAENMTILNDEEIKGVISAIEKENKIVNDVAEFSVKTEPDGISPIDLVITGYNPEKGYKTYALENFIITEYKNKRDFKFLINNECHIQIPADGKSLTISLEETGEYIISKTRFSEDKFDFKLITEEVLKNIDEEIVTVINAESFLYNMNIIYVETSENEYAIPYFDERMNGEYGGYGDRLISGTIYSVAEFMDKMDQIYDEEYLFAHGDEDGGVPLKAYTPYVPSFSENVAAQSKNISVKDGSDTFKFIVAGVGVGISVVFLATIVILKKKSK